MSQPFDRKAYATGYKKGQSDAIVARLDHISVSLARIAIALEKGKLVDALQVSATQSENITDLLHHINQSLPR